jgi:hypothetical protein
MRYGVTLEHGGWVVWDTITKQIVTHPATSEEAQAACREFEATAVFRPVDPPIPVDGWGPQGELTLWALADGVWWGSVRSKTGVRWIKADDLRPR